MTAFVYDTGALVAAERRSWRLWGLHDEVMAVGRYPLVPAAVLGQAWRGGPQQQLSRALRGCVVVPDTEELARAAGAACAAVGTSDIVDALVVVLAVRHQAVIVTSDPDDLTRITDGLGAKLQLHLV